MGPAPDVRRWLPVMGLVVGVWAMLPKFVTPPLNTADRVEFADHVVPGLVVVAVSAAVLALRRGAGSLGLVPFFAGAVVLLAGFWMVATHVPLVAQAFRDEAPWAGTVYHTAAAVAVFGLGLLWTASHWPDLAHAGAAEPAARPERRA